MRKLNICIDIDGTITDPYHFIPYLNEIYNKNITPEECTTYNWAELYQLEHDDILEQFHGKYIYSYSEAKVVEFAYDIICKLREAHNLYFVTARSENLTQLTYEWLNVNGFSNIDVFLLGSDYKIDKARELGCNIFIEDNPFNAIDLADAGMTVLLMDANYNKNIEHERIVRVKNWLDIQKFIEEYGGRYGRM